MRGLVADCRISVPSFSFCNLAVLLVNCLLSLYLLYSDSVAGTLISMMAWCTEFILSAFGFVSCAHMRRIRTRTQVVPAVRHCLLLQHGITRI